jgi:hypothetical protein
MLEIFFLVGLVFLIAVLFYKQRRSSTELLQAEESQLDEQLSDLLAEQQPLIVRGISPPKGVTLESLKKITRLSQFSVGGQPLEAVLENPSILSSANGSPVLSKERREIFATELSTKLWADHVWLPKFSQTTWLGSMIGCMISEIVLGGMGMFRTTATYTCIMPTEGIYTVSIVSRESESFLPKAWEYRYPGDLSPNDTPLVSDLKYMDVIVRPGTMICFPAHFIISMKPKSDEFTAAAILEYHEPVSLLAKSLS